MIHNLTIGHFDIDAVGERLPVVLNPLDHATVLCHQNSLGHRGEAGWTLVGSGQNPLAEEFALRTVRDRSACELRPFPWRRIAPTQCAPPSSK